MTFVKTARALMLMSIVGAASAIVAAQTVEDRTQDKVAFPAFKIMGNLYYVGTGTLNSYLVTTPAGDILINTNYEDTVPLMEASLKSLGFKWTDVKIILGSHAHPDHQQADAMVKELTGGAPVTVMGEDVDALKAIKAPSGKPHPIDRVLKDGDTVSLGGTTLTAHLTPGHTRGCTTWTMMVQDNGRPRSVVIACGGLPDDARLVNNKNYPEVADDYARAIRAYRGLNGEVFLAAHSWFFDLAGKHAKLVANPKATNPYIDPDGYKKWVEDMDKLRTKLIADQKAATPTN